MITLSAQNVTLDFPISHLLRGGEAVLTDGQSGELPSRFVSKRDGVYMRALNEVSLSLKAGDRLALVGSNGAGKSTLLRVLGGILIPTNGLVLASGAIGMILSTSIGFHPQASGYENIHTRGLMLGLTRREIDGARDDIEEFTELGEFLKLPISTYSAGMLARLAFAVTTYMRPDILLVDEAVGAGDPVFMRKARTRMLGIADSASILVLASQSRQIIENFCNKAVLLSEGSIVLADDLREVCDRYFGPSPLPKLASDKVSVAAEKYVE